MTSLVLEGGTFRPIFSAGVMDALLDNDIMLPYVIGVSAGISNGLSYISKQPKRNYDVLINLRNDKRYIGRSNIIKNKSIFGIDFAFDEVPNKIYPFDWETYRGYEGKILIGVTNALTGRAEYFDGKNMDTKCTMLRASCAIPLVFPKVMINNKPYFDGGLADPIPIRKAIQDGNDKHIIILTRPKEYRKTLSKGNKVAAKIFKRQYPKLSYVLLNRHTDYNETVRYCEELERRGKAIIIRPDKAIESLEKDVNVLKETYQMGYNMALSEIEKIKKFVGDNQ